MHFLPTMCKPGCIGSYYRPGSLICESPIPDFTHRPRKGSRRKRAGVIRQKTSRISSGGDLPHAAGWERNQQVASQMAATKFLKFVFVHPAFGFRGRGASLSGRILGWSPLVPGSRLNGCMASTRAAGMIFRQMFDHETCTYTYLLADDTTKDAVLIDPVIELAERDAQLVKDLGLNLKYVMNTHVHADHITGTGLLKKLIPGCQSLISKESGATADIHVQHGETVTFGNHELEVRSTPGHTNGCIAYVSHAQKLAFTGDALLIRGCGRTDFQEGSSENLYDSVHSQILSLDDDFLLYPAHDYKGQTVTTVAEEKEFNPRLTKSKEEFVKIMNNLGLAYPKKIDVSLPANKVCGLYNLPADLAAKLEEK